VVEQSDELLVGDRAAWRTWLEVEHERSSGVWLVLAKKGAAAPNQLHHDEALEEALCFGWIDARLQRRSETSFRQRFTPRRARSGWSRRNVEIAERLVAEGSMHPAGLRQIELARADGRWEAAYAGAATIEVPADLAAALRARPAARATFELLNSQNRYSILYRLGTARRAETRARRLEQFVAMLERRETLYPQRLDAEA